LGRLYFNGWGTAVDYAQAIQWLERDKEPEGIKYDLLGICYLLGVAASRTRHGEKHFWRKARIRPIKVMVWG